MGSDHSKMLIFYPFFKCYHIFRHIPYFLNCSAAFDLKGIQNFLSFCTDSIFICNIISNSPHFLPVKLFCIQEHSVVQICLINIEIHHTRIRSSNLCDISITESSSYLSSLTPIFDLCLNSRISTFYNTCDHRVSLACSLQVCHSFAYCTACIPLS